MPSATALAPPLRATAALKLLASPRLTVAFFLLTAASALAAKEGLVLPTQAMLLPFVLLVVNLLAAIVHHPRFRTDLPLLVFHLALLALIALFTLGRLTYMYGSVSLTRDSYFDGIIDYLDVGPLHPSDYRQLRFGHGGLSERFNDTVGHQLNIRSRIRWQDKEQRWQQTELNFGYPVVLDGYRIYPSGRRGYAPMFLWQPHNGPEEIGAVQLFGPGDPQVEMSNDWKMPNGQAAWVLLEPLVPGPPPVGTVRQDLDADKLAHKLILRTGDTRRELVLGDTIDVPGGRLRYVKLESWAGYSLVYDPTEPWLIATILVAVAALAWFYSRRFKRRPLEPDAA